MKKVYRNLFQELGREPTDLEIANYMNVSERKIILLKQTFMDMVSLNESSSGKDDSELILMDMIEDKSFNMEDDIFASELREQLYDGMKEYLSDTEFFVIESRFGMRDGTRYTLEKVGNDLRVTRERIRQIE